MPYHHEYHLAGTVEKDPVHPTVVSTRARKSLPLTTCILTGILAATVIIFTIAHCVHPYVLNTDDLSSEELNRVENSSVKTQNTSSSDFGEVNHADNSSENTSSLDFGLLEDFNEENLYEIKFIGSLSPSEKESIRLLRLTVEDKLTHSYMRTANYLARWLRARDWDLEDAKDMLLDHLEWRIEYEIDSVLTDNFTYFEQEFPVYYDGVANNGGPVATLSAEEFDLSKIAIGGNRRELIRYAARIFEEAIDSGYKMQSKGTMISQGMLILNINNYSYAKHGCFTCLSVLGSVFFAWDENYPGWLNPIFVINTSDLADAVVNIMLPYVNGENREAIEIFGYNKDEWQKRVLTFVAADQIRVEFGGTKVDEED